MLRSGAWRGVDLWGDERERGYGETERGYERERGTSDEPKQR